MLSSNRWERKRRSQARFNENRVTPAKRELNSGSVRSRKPLKPPFVQGGTCILVEGSGAKGMKNPPAAGLARSLGGELVSAPENPPEVPPCPRGTYSLCLTRVVWRLLRAKRARCPTRQEK